MALRCQMISPTLINRSHTACRRRLGATFHVRGADARAGAWVSRNAHSRKKSSATRREFFLPFGNNELEPDNARPQSLLACIEREEAFEFQLKRTGDVQNIERSTTDRGCVLTT